RYGDGRVGRGGGASDGRRRMRGCGGGRSAREAHGRKAHQGREERASHAPRVYQRKHTRSSAVLSAQRAKPPHARPLMPSTPPRTERPFLDAVRAGVLVVDGAMGTQLYERGVLFSACFEELNVSRPELVGKVHEDYIRAGAHVIETNTFGANALRLEKHGLQSRVRELNAAGVQVARAAAAGQVYVAGAIGPSGHFLGDPSAADLAKGKAAFSAQA